MSRRKKTGGLQSEAARKAGSVRSTAKARAARANGQRGAAGGKLGGRPRTPNRYEQIFTELGDPPMADPLALAHWGQRVAARLTVETGLGRGSRSVNEQVRAFLGVIARLMPQERLWQVAEALKRARTPRKPVARKGPEMVPVDPEATPSPYRNLRL